NPRGAVRVPGGWLRLGRQSSLGSAGAGAWANCNRRLAPGFVGRNAPLADCRTLATPLRVSQHRPGHGIPRALTARHVGVAPSIVNNNPETREWSWRPFPTAA